MRHSNQIGIFWQVEISAISKSVQSRFHQSQISLCLNAVQGTAIAKPERGLQLRGGGSVSFFKYSRESLWFVATRRRASAAR
jgi:hypothetical protein